MPDYRVLFGLVSVAVLIVRWTAMRPHGASWPSQSSVTWTFVGGAAAAIALRLFGEILFGAFTDCLGADVVYLAAGALFVGWGAVLLIKKGHEEMEAGL